MDLVRWIAVGLERMKRWIKRLAILTLLAALAAAAPVVWVETSCMHDGTPAANDYASILAREHQRNEINTYLTYPQWAIVHAYEDFAAVVRARGETAFRYRASIREFWSNLCTMTRYASARGTISPDVRAMLHIIGVSFSAAMGVKGIYENTFGRLSEMLRGSQRTPEDEFALATADDYAKFLRQTPWHEYPFAATLARFWREVPWSGGSLARKVERRIGLSLEYGVKAIYAKAIGAFAGLAPAELRIRSVVRGPEPDDPRIVLVERRDDGTTIIETPRYRAFTEILIALAAHGHGLVEIAGNDDVFVTALTPPGAKAPFGEPIIAVPIQSRFGWRREGIAMKVGQLAEAFRAFERQGIRIEHVYDY